RDQSERPASAAEAGTRMPGQKPRTAIPIRTRPGIQPRDSLDVLFARNDGRTDAGPANGDARPAASISDRRNIAALADRRPPHTHHRPPAHCDDNGEAEAGGIA